MPKYRRSKCLRNLRSAKGVGDCVVVESRDSDDILGVGGLERRLSLAPAFPDVSKCDEKYLVDSKMLLAIAHADNKCGECGVTAHVDVISRTTGFAVIIRCIDCDNIITEIKSDKVDIFEGLVCKYDASFVCAVYSSLTNGGGFSGYCRFMSNLSVSHTVSSALYNECSHYLYEAMNRYSVEMTSFVLQSVRKSYENVDGPIDVHVSYDGTWMTRGHKSHVGVGFIIDCNTGFILDFEVLSNDCALCTKKSNILSEEEFETWKATHDNCKQNFRGKSGAMETEAAIRLWSRSEARGYRYVTFVGDGDSSAFNAVCAMNDGEGPYSVPVVKEECVNHVSKRLGTRLRKLKDTLKTSVVTKKGKEVQRSALAGRGDLTNASIDLLSKYYSQNIRKFPSDGNVSDLRNLILSSYYHASSTDTNPMHTHCDTSFCWVKKAEAAGTVPAAHSTKSLFLSHISKDLRSKILSVYIDLTSPALLSRCLRKMTQNANESLHSKLWMKALKVKDAKLDRVRFITFDTVHIHNFGNVHGCLLTRLGLSSEKTIDKRRRSDVSRPASVTPKRRRRDEAGPSHDYQPGGF